MKNISKLLLLIAVGLLLSIESQAQVDSLIIHLNDGTKKSLTIDELTKADFKSIETGNMAIVLNTGWNLISSNIKPQLPDSINLVLSDIESNLLIAKNNSGQVYIPSFNINTIGSWNVSQGYLCYMIVPDTITVVGSIVEPSDTPIQLNTGWNTISYMRNSEMNAENAFVSITDNDNLLITKTLEGKVYIPSFGINTIGNLKPGVGYKVYVTNSDTLLYPGN